MPHRLQTLKIKNFRGATCPVDIEFDISKPAVLVFGENGTGKSTIIDALEFIFNESFGSLDSKSSVTPKTHAPSLGCQAEDIEIQSTFGGQSWSARWGKTGPLCTGPSQNKPSIKILRRDIILELVNATPKDRYLALQNFIGIPQIEANEATLRNAMNAVQKDYEKDSQILAEYETKLEEYWESAGRPDGNCSAWAKNCAKHNLGTLQASTLEAQKIIDAIKSTQTAYTAYQINLSQCKVQKASSETAAAALKQAEQTLSGVVGGLTLLALLKDTAEFLKLNPTTNKCPVCDTGITPVQILDCIAARIQQMQNLDKCKQVLDSANTKVYAADARSMTSAQQFLSAIRSLIKIAQSSSADEIITQSLPWQKYAILLTEEADGLSNEIMALAQDISQNISASMGPLETRKLQESNLLNKLNAVKSYSADISGKRENIACLQNLQKRLYSMAETYKDIRKRYVDDLLDSISTDIATIYNKIHPGEKIGKVRFFLNPKHLGSLECKGQFQDKDDVPPQAYYSESHLDTLGVCVFLALQKYFQHENAVVILDDVITSVDENHMTRFINAIQDEAENFNQLIITTHYRPWREMYRYARSQSSKVQLLELLHWSIQRGVRHTKTRLSVDELKDYLGMEPLERQIVSSKAGILLESLLDHITYLYECRLPRKPEPFYTLGDLLISLGKLKNVLIVEKVPATGTPIQTNLKDSINALESLTWIRNKVGCHWDTRGDSVSSADVEDFANKTIAFAESLICAECGAMPRKILSGSYWQCGCGKHRLYPLDRPN